MTVYNYKMYFRSGNIEEDKDDLAAALDTENIEDACNALMDVPFVYRNVPAVPAARDVLGTAIVAWRDSWKATNKWSMHPER